MAPPLTVTTEDFAEDMRRFQYQYPSPPPEMTNIIEHIMIATSTPVLSPPLAVDEDPMLDDKGEVAVKVGLDDENPPSEKAVADADEERGGNGTALAFVKFPAHMVLSWGLTHSVADASTTHNHSTVLVLQLFALGDGEVQNPLSQQGVASPGACTLANWSSCDGHGEAW
jgi:hypothetical protein